MDREAAAEGVPRWAWTDGNVAGRGLGGASRTAPLPEPLKCGRLTGGSDGLPPYNVWKREGVRIAYRGIADRLQGGWLSAAAWRNRRVRAAGVFPRCPRGWRAVAVIGFPCGISPRHARGSGRIPVAAGS